MSGWKKGRGLLGPLQPLLGRWVSEAGDSNKASAARCMRVFEAFGQGFVRLEANWKIESRGTYREVAFFGKAKDGSLGFWSFTSDGKRSEGLLADARQVHPSAIAFEAEMPAGTARMLYWPNDDREGFNFAVESKVKKGWSRFVHHIYRPVR